MKQGSGDGDAHALAPSYTPASAPESALLRAVGDGLCRGVRDGRCAVSATGASGALCGGVCDKRVCDGVRPCVAAVGGEGRLEVGAGQVVRLGAGAVNRF